MRILFTCGGSGGHINPAIAVANTLLEDNPNIEILFAGNPNKMEATLVPKAGFAFEPILVEGFQRHLSFENIKRNLAAIKFLMFAGSRAKEIITNFAPDIVVGTGGYASGPILRKAAKLCYPTITHESNAYPGLTTKILSKDVDKVLLGYENAKKYLPDREYILTGNPVRAELLNLDREKVRKELGVGDRICILSTGGSNGAEQINRTIAELIVHCQPHNQTHHIHATGRFGVELMPRLLKEKGVDLEDKHLDIREYIYDMDNCLAAADLVICRAGAMTLVELQAVGRGAILIPSPNVAENHQYHNALTLAENNAAIVLEEKDLTGKKLCQIVDELVADPQEIRNLSKNAASMGITNGARRICDEIYDLLEKKKKQKRT